MSATMLKIKGFNMRITLTELELSTAIRAIAAQAGQANDSGDDHLMQDSLDTLKTLRDAYANHLKG